MSRQNNPGAAEGKFPPILQNGEQYFRKIPPLTPRDEYGIIYTLIPK